MGARNSLLRTIVIMCAVLYSAFPLSAADTEEGSWDIHLNTESIERILLYPEKILANPDLFWTTDKAYRFADSWHRNTKIPKTTKNYYNKWLEFLKQQSRIPMRNRKKNAAFQFLETLKGKMDIYFAKAIPHIQGFLPVNKISFKAGIYLTTRTLPYAFMTNGNMVLDPLSYKFKMDADAIFNSLTHETFHIGYGYNRYLRREQPLANGFHYNVMLDSLQNEGMAVYMAWKARSFFPAPDEEDYRFLEDMREVKKRFKWINEIFAAAEEGEITPEALRRKSWDLGVDQRGYYITGAFMSRCIDERLGRKALVKTVMNGPLSFVDQYNQIADPGMKVYRFKRPETASTMHKLRTAVLGEDAESFIRLVKHLKENPDSIENGTQSRLVRMGYGQVYLKNWPWAIRVFQVGTELFPKSPNAWDCLAEAHMKSGDLQAAKKYYRKALEADPTFSNAVRMLSRIGKMEREVE